MDRQIRAHWESCMISALQMSMLPKEIQETVIRLVREVLYNKQDEGSLTIISADTSVEVSRMLKNLDPAQRGALDRTCQHTTKLGAHLKGLYASFEKRTGEAGRSRPHYGLNDPMNDASLSTLMRSEHILLTNFSEIKKKIGIIFGYIPSCVSPEMVDNVEVGACEYTADMYFGEDHESQRIFAEEITPLIRQAAEYLHAILSNAMYVPNSGKGEQDLRDFLHYLGEVTAAVDWSVTQSSGKSAHPLQAAVSTVMNSSVRETLLIDFLRKRFPAVLDVRDPKDMTEDSIREKRETILMCLQVVHSIVKGMKANTSMRNMCLYMETLERSLFNLCSLSNMADILGSRGPMHPLPEAEEAWRKDWDVPIDATVLIERKDDDGRKRDAIRCRRIPAFTQNIVTSANLHRERTGEFAAHVVLHELSGKPCLSSLSCIPLSAHFQPEHPLAQMAGYFNRATGELTLQARHRCEEHFLDSAFKQAEKPPKTARYIHIDLQSAHFECFLFTGEEVDALGIRYRVQKITPQHHQYLQSREYPFPDDHNSGFYVLIVGPDDDDDEDGEKQLPPAVPFILEPTVFGGVDSTV